jgi:PTH1 family peptidyl-tRNA hydrolase
MENAPPCPPIRLLVGLGNPGCKFEGTRHNLGFALVEKLAAQAGVSFQTETKWPARLARVGPLHLLEPLTFMNLSGQAVGAYAAYYRIEPSQILVVLDDLALPPGRMRLRRQGSDGGHNGLASIIQHLGTTEIPRLRLGIGSPSFDAAQFVLSRPTADEAPLLDQALERSLEVLALLQDKGLDAAMNFANATGLT